MKFKTSAFILSILLLGSFSIAMAASKEIIIERNKTFKIELPSNPTTGFNWYFDNLDQNRFKVISSGFSPSSKKLIGAGGTSWWEIKALKLGKKSIYLLYYRTWEGKNKAVDRCEIRVVVVK